MFGADVSSLPTRIEREQLCRFDVRLDKVGSARESDEGRILSGFLERDEFGLSGGQTLRLQQQVVEIAITATTTQ